MTLLISEVTDKVKRLITLPTDDTLFNTTDYIAFVNDLLIEKIYPRVMKIRDDYFLVREVFPLQNSSAQDLYPTGVMPIPARAWGNTLREIKYIDNSGNYYKINPYFLEDLDLYQSKNLALSSSYQKGFIPFNNGIKLIPPPLQDNGSIEMHYIISPSTVINDSTSVVGILNMQFNTSNNVTTYTTDDIDNNDGISIYCPLNSTRLFDIYNLQTGMLVAINQPLARIATETFTGTSIVQGGTGILSPNITELTNFQLGGYPNIKSVYSTALYLTPAGQNCYTPLTPVLDNLLIYELAIKILSAQGYAEELNIFLAEHADLRKDLLSQMALRVDAEPYVLKNTRGIRTAVIYGGFGGRRY